ncbi:MAG TPA: hypothetical protein DG754_09485, partial [Bacteroidales bacterium]|nr:hypothetical protein [Bacteroidales bacterium]
GCTATDEVVVEINPQTSPGTLSGGDNICEGSTSGVLTLTGYTGSVIRWEKSVDPFDTWTEIAHTQDTYTSNPLSETTRFRAVVQNGVCDAMESNYTEVEVTPTPVAGNIDGNNLVCAGSSPTLTLIGYNGTIVRWEYSANGTIWESNEDSDPTFYAPVINQITQY